jgi:hypothetical protein
VVSVVSESKGAIGRLERFAETGDTEVLLEGLPEQIRLLPDPCAICGRYTGLMIEQGGVFACVECHTKENGEDGDG